MNTLTVTPEQVNLIQDHRTLESPEDAGMLQRRSVFQNATSRKRTYELRWETASESDFSSLRAFFRSVFGNAGEFFWTPPNETERVFRFAGPSLDWRKSLNRYAMRVFVIESG